jgi:DNA primase
MAIPDDKIEDIRATADIVDVVGDYVQLKKSGSGYKGLCPFHNEKTPSFHVDPNKNLFYCFGCQKGGDVFSFLQEIEGLSFVESARLLAERAGIPLPDDAVDDEAAGEVESIYHALRFAARFFYRQLTQSDRGKPALDYLRQRGITPPTIKKFGLGYAPDAWDALLTAAEEKQVDPDVLEKAGLIIERKDGSGHYDRYRNRIIFPIFSHVGKVLGFGGRILDDEADQPKYINSPETRVYDKSRALYGLRQAKRAIRQEEEAILVEGYTDVISLHQAGIEHAVASSGTALTEQQVHTLGRYAKRLVLLYDADEAGARAARRAMDLVLAEELGAYVVELPDGEDPDSFVQSEGVDAFARFLAEERQDLPTFRHRKAQRGGELDTPEDRVAVQRGIMRSIAKIPDASLRREYVRRTSEVLGVPDNDLFRMLEEARNKERRQAARREKRQEAARAPRPEAPSTREDMGETDEAASETDAAPAGPLPEEKVLTRLLLEHGEPMVEFILGNMALDEFSAGPTRKLVRALVTMYEEGAVDPQRALSGSLGADVQNLAASVMMDEYEPSKNWGEREVKVPRLNDKPYEAAASAMTLLKLDRVNEAIDAHRQKIYRADQDDDADTLRTLQNQMMALHDLRKRIERREYLEWSEQERGA